MPKFISPATEDEMILEFIRSELGSPRFGKFYPELLINPELRTRLVGDADINNSEDNITRQKLLDYRGYATRTKLFASFPTSVAWSRQRLSRAEVAALKYARLDDTIVWDLLSAPSRLVAAAAARLGEPLDQLLQNPSIASYDRERLRVVRSHILAVAQRYRNGEQIPMPIAVRDESTMVLLEGHVRATAFAVDASSEALDILLGETPTMRVWERF